MNIQKRFSVNYFIVSMKTKPDQGQASIRLNLLDVKRGLAQMASLLV